MEPLTEEEKADLNKQIADLRSLPNKWLKADIIGWDGLCDFDGSDIPFNKVNLRDLLDSVPFMAAISEVWSEAHGGVTKLAENEADSKN